MRGFPFSVLHLKGSFTLALLVAAETLTVSNAVNLWSNYQSWLDKTTKSSFFENFNGLSRQQECEVSEGMLSSSTTCQSSPKFGISTFFSRTQSSRHTLKNPTDCCEDCVRCMELKQCTNIPRGGQTSETIAETVTSTVGVTPHGIPLHLWKVIFQAILTAINVVCWLVPLRTKKMTENKLALSLANSFSGGVFLSLAFGHLIPECVHGFSEYQEAVPFLFVLSGYMVIFFVEKVAFDAHDILHEMEQGSHESNKPDGELNDAPNNASGSGRSAVILLGALAVHSILEMAALGLADSFADCALLSLSIALHQPAESIALLVAFVKSGMPKNHIIQFLSAFSAMGPIGVALGMAVNQFASPVVDSAMIAIVAGTFLYVGATEVIPEEWEDSEHKWKKFGALMGGIVSILVITQYTATLEVN